MYPNQLLLRRRDITIITTITPLVPRQRKVQRTGGNQDGRIGTDFGLDIIIIQRCLGDIVDIETVIKRISKVFSHSKNRSKCSCRKFY
jgi:hypothetical protein